MNCQNAKKIPIIGFLSSQGIQPISIKNGTARFPSPFSKDSNPSFFVDYKKEYDLQVWKDFSTGDGGNILDLIMKMYNVDIAGALIILQKPELPNSNFSFFSQQSINSKKPQPDKIQIKHLQPLQNRALVQYLSSRGISQSKAVNFVQEAYYKVNDKQYFALAFKNDNGGFELRNKYFKGSSSPKTITTIKGNSNAINIFEGFIDFLSALEYYSTRKPLGTTIILNSTSNLEYVFKLLSEFKYINLFLDNDQTGNKAAQTIQSKFNNVKDYSKIIYPDHNDFNDYLVK